MRSLSLSTLVFLSIFCLQSCTTPSSGGGQDPSQTGAHPAHSAPEEKFSGPVVQAVADPSVSTTVFHLDAPPQGAFVLNLHNAPAEAPVNASARKTSPKPLSEQEVESLLRRLPEMKQDEARAFAYLDLAQCTRHHSVREHSLLITPEDKKSGDILAAGTRVPGQRGGGQ